MPPLYKPKMLIRQEKSNIYVVNVSKPSITINQLKPGITVWTDIKTPHYKILGQGTPIGLLLTLTYNADISILTNL